MVSRRTAFVHLPDRATVAITPTRPLLGQPARRCPRPPWLPAMCDWARRLRKRMIPSPCAWSAHAATRNVCLLRTELAHLSAGNHPGEPDRKRAKSAIWPRRWAELGSRSATGPGQRRTRRYPPVRYLAPGDRALLGNCRRTTHGGREQSGRDWQPGPGHRVRPPGRVTRRPGNLRW